MGAVRGRVPGQGRRAVTVVGEGDAHGRLPDSERSAVGYPDAVTVNPFWTPDTKVAASPLVMAGASSTINVKDWWAWPPTPLSAVMVIG